jgi:hypothetical protein
MYEEKEVKFVDIERQNMEANMRQEDHWYYTVN